MNIEGRRAAWFLQDNGEKRGLLSQLPESFLTYGHIVRLENEATSTQAFLAFNSTEELNTYMKKFPPEKRFFHEYIPGNQRTKPRFDLDVECDDPTGPYDSTRHLERITPANVAEIGRRALSALLDAICRVFNLMMVQSKRILSFFPEEHIVIYDSNTCISGYPISYKASYHVIINGFCHENHNEARAFATAVTKEMTFGKCFVDFGVYTKNCFLRTLDSRKVKGIGVFSGLKRRMSSYLWGNNLIESKLRYPLFGFIDSMTPDGIVPLDSPDYSLLALRESLVTYVRDEISLPSLYSEIERKKFNTVLTKEIVDSMMALLRAWLPNVDMIFALHEVKDNIIHLKRLLPSYCSMCNRTHDNRDPLLFLAYKAVRFYCCRNPDRKYESLGRIDFIENENFESESESEEDEEYETLPDGLDKPIEEIHFRKPVGMTMIMNMDQVQIACDAVRQKKKQQIHENKKVAKVQRCQIIGSTVANSLKPRAVETVGFRQEQISFVMKSSGVDPSKGRPKGVSDPTSWNE